jgi:streptogrisin C
MSRVASWLTRSARSVNVDDGQGRATSSRNAAAEDNRGGDDVARRGLATLLGLMLLASTAAPVGAARGHHPDAAAYAAMYSVTLDEADFQLGVTSDVLALQERLRQSVPSTFGGLWITHSPSFGVVVALTDERSEARALRLVPSALAALVTIRPVRFSETELETAIRQVKSSAGAPVNLSIDLPGNRIEVQTSSRTRLLTPGFARATRGIPIVVRDVADLGSPATDIYGGLYLSTCTGGFVVKLNGSSTKGISTAGHCSDSQAFGGVTLPFQAGSDRGYVDVQWHKTPGLTALPKFKVGSNTRNVQSVFTSTSYAVGQTLCKQGNATGYTCGEVRSTSQCPTWITNCYPVFLRIVNCSQANMSDHGDSGGPVFIGTAAAGLVSGFTADVECITKHSLVASKIYLDMSAMGTSVVVAP